MGLNLDGFRCAYLGKDYQMNGDACWTRDLTGWARDAKNV